MKSTLNYGDEILWNGKRVKCTGKHAQGVWHTYHFDDGSHFNGDAAAMFADGALKELESPQVKIKPVMPWTPKRGLDGPPTKS